MFGRSKGKPIVSDGPMDPNWATSARGRFHRLIRLDPEAEGLSRLGGVYVVWHAGVRPEWVFVGHTEDLADTFHHVGRNSDIMEFEINGGLYVSWCLIREEYRDGVVRHLHDTLKPLVDNVAISGMDVAPVPIIAPRLESAGDDSP